MGTSKSSRENVAGFIQNSIPVISNIARSQDERWMTIELVGFCFSQTDCFSLQILSQTINTVSALDKPALNTLQFRVFKRSGQLFFFLPFFLADRPTLL